MSEDSSHASVRPSSSVTMEAGKRVAAKSARKGEPSFHMTEQMRRLSTPCLLYTSPSPRDGLLSRMPSSA